MLLAHTGARILIFLFWLVYLITVVSYVIYQFCLFHYAMRLAIETSDSRRPRQISNSMNRDLPFLVPLRTALF
jgi:hypothetical protein